MQIQKNNNFFNIENNHKLFALYRVQSAVAITNKHRREFVFFLSIIAVAVHRIKQTNMRISLKLNEIVAHCNWHFANGIFLTKTIVFISPIFIFDSIKIFAI